MSHDVFDKDYYERGIESGKSCYENYRWMPELTIACCKAIMSHIGLQPGQRLLDFGCSKGFYVRAFNELGVMADGWDVSRYAIENSDPAVKDRVRLIDGVHYPFSPWYDWVLAKDVLEHMDITELRNFFQHIPSGRAYLIIPLGIGTFFDKRNDMDKTHKTCMPAWWWGDLIAKERWSVVGYSEKVEGVKQTWATRDAYGHFVCMRLDEVK